MSSQGRRRKDGSLSSQLETGHRQRGKCVRVSLNYWICLMTKKIGSNFVLIHRR